MTGAHKAFQANIERSRAFLRIFDKEPDGGRRQGQPTKDEKELLRGSLVFAVGALDAYLHDLILEIVPAYAPKSEKLTTALRGIAKSDPSLSLRVALASSDQDRQQQFRDALSEWLEDKSFQGPEKVSNALSYVGCTLTWPEFDKVTGKSTASELERITGERHAIVHRGEFPYVRRLMAGETIDLIAAMVKLIDDEVCKLYL
jgi:RiboL-PSP-HEPN